jgi:hypothetical protein
MRLLALLVNHSAPSGPVVIPSGESTLPAGSANVANSPAGVMRPMRPFPKLVNQ